MNAPASAAITPWESLAGVHRARRGFTWNILLWSLIYPRRGQRTMPTTSGTVLIALSFGIGSAAYNTANNILFIALSLMLACLILSGVLAWLNFRRLAWRLNPPPSFRAGHDAIVSIDVRNGKRVLPAYGIWFGLVGSPVVPEKPLAPGAKRPSVRELVAAAEKTRTRARLFLRHRLDPGAEVRLEWVLRPAQRGLLRLELEGIGSLFPFGFLQKQIRSMLRREVRVWPAPVEYRSQPSAAARPRMSGLRTASAGSGSDLFALRNYAPGDSHRLIHWKASARGGQLVVRQFAAESQESFALWFQSDAELWPREEQFELAVGLAGSLAEDLYRAGTLATVAVDGEPAQPVRRVRDLEAFLDQLAVIQRRQGSGERRSVLIRQGSGGRTNLVTFAPDGARGVAAYVDGNKTATA